MGKPDLDGVRTVKAELERMNITKEDVGMNNREIDGI